MIHKKKALLRPFSALLALCLLGSGLAACGNSSSESEAPAPSAASTPQSEAPAQSEAEAEDGIENPVVDELHAERYAAIPLPEEMRAMWIAYPDFEDMDFSSEAAFRVEFSLMAENCAELGLNTLIVIVRPFADALYPSGYYPWSYLIDGTQGTDPGFDPLAVMIEQAHQHGLRFEAYINPYRVKLNEQKPGELCDESPAVTNAQWAVQVGESLWFDPAIPAVQELVVNGVLEILENYPVDGIHFDDYFYPIFADILPSGAAEADEEFDAATYAEYGGGLPRAQWRRDNVDTLMRDVYDAIKSYNPSVSFGISPTGNRENNYAKLYADVDKWMAEPGYVDYIMPQLYWEFGFALANGSTQFAFENITVEWGNLPRAEGVTLYAGLAPYKIHEGVSDDWRTGDVLAGQVEYLRDVAAYDGFALFRYGSLYEGGNEAERAAEILHLQSILHTEEDEEVPGGEVPLG